MTRATQEAITIFDTEEMEVRSVPVEITRDELLAQIGLYHLRDIAKILALDSTRIKRQAQKLHEEGQNPWEVMGVRKVWKSWLVKMSTFGPYYHQHLARPYTNVPADWNGNRLMQEETGIFPLTQVCRRIPFTAHQLRNQTKKHRNPRREIGVWKDEQAGIFLVDIRIFRRYVASLWGKA